MLRLLAAFLAFLFLNAFAVRAVSIDVGETGFLFVPPTVTATNGTTVTFKLYGSHTVTQSTFAAPCTHSGFNSGPLTNGTFFNITITDDSLPIWFYCTVDTHCGMGMVGAINPPTTGNTYDAFHAAAIALGANEPAQTDAATPVASGVGATVSGAAASSAAPSGTATAPATHSASAPATSSTSGATQVSFGIGSAIGGVLALLAAAA